MMISRVWMARIVGNLTRWAEGDIITIVCAQVLYGQKRSASVYLS